MSAAAEASGADFVRACSLADLRADQALQVDVDGVDVAVARVGDEVFAIADECSHANIPLSEGEIEDCTIECWLHGSRFDLRTGNAINLPANLPVPVYPVRVEGDDVYVGTSPVPR
jgi:3-phenylpropionate/trans-cinnamate dioxygenase ferredoxin subunit